MKPDLKNCKLEESSSRSIRVYFFPFVQVHVYFIYFLERKKKHVEHKVYSKYY